MDRNTAVSYTHLDVYKRQFFNNAVYRSKIRENPNKFHYVPLRKDLLQIKAIIITNQDEKGNLFKKDGRRNIIYLRLKQQ